MELTQEYVKELFDYNPDTGDLIWKVSRSNHIKIGDVAGSKNSTTGYMQVKIDYTTYLIHRIIWLWYYGEFPKNFVDHKNGVRSDNRIENLRDVTATENMRNRKRSHHNTSGVTGVTWYKRLNKWCTRIKINRKYVHLGYFTDFNDAVAARKAAEEEYGFHENHGREE